MKNILYILFLLSFLCHAQQYPIPFGGTDYSFYATLNPADRTDKQTVISTDKLSVSTVAVGGGYRAVRATIGISNSTAVTKGYWEFAITSGAIPDNGISNLSFLMAFSGSNPEPGNDGGGNSWSYLSNSGSPFKGNGGTFTAYGSSFTSGDTLGVALDMTNGFVYFGKVVAGIMVWQNSGVPTSGATGTGAAFGSLTGTLYPTFGTYSGNAFSYTCNFGAIAFWHSAPIGYSGIHH